ncbi:MAG: phosphotriesterase family protein [Dehalococcoidia bacterium]
MATVNTVTGPIETSELGFTLMHEHVIVKSPGLVESFPSVWNRADEMERAVMRLRDVAARGVKTILDATTADMGRDIEFVAEVARRSGVQIIAATGLYLDVPRYFHSRGADVMAELFVKEIEEGMAGTQIKAGVIKCATDEAGAAGQIEKVLRACARAHRATGVPITTHTFAAGQTGTVQQDIFESEGVDLSRVIIGHCGDSKDIDYLLQIIGRGSYIGMDRFGLDMFLPTADRVATIAQLCKMGHADRMILSHDANSYMDWFERSLLELTAPNWHYNYVPDSVIPALLESGVSENEIHQMTVDNPRRIFENCQPY